MKNTFISPGRLFGILEKMDGVWNISFRYNHFIAFKAYVSQFIFLALQEKLEISQKSLKELVGKVY